MDLITFEASRPSRPPVSVVQIEGACAPLANIGDLVRLRWTPEFEGEGVYAIRLGRPGRLDWSGLRKLRQGAVGLEVLEGDDWTPMSTIPAGFTLHIVGRVLGFYHSNLEFARQDQEQRRLVH